jgi:hypothetical protein
MGTKLDEPIATPGCRSTACRAATQPSGSGRATPTAASRSTTCRPGLFPGLLGRESSTTSWTLCRSRCRREVTDVGRAHHDQLVHQVVWHGLPRLSTRTASRIPASRVSPTIMVVLRDRDNTEIDRMSIASVTDANGFYELEKGYPMGSWMVLEAYSDLYRTTGVTYQALNNAKEETTILGAIVDMAVLPIFSQPVRLDWGVKFPTTQGTNGGIAGTVFYDTVRAEDDARYAGAEPWQPGIPG